MIFFIIIAFLIFPAFAFPQDLTYTGANAVNLILEGEQNDQIYQSDQMTAAYGRDKNTLVFSIPSATFMPFENSGNPALIHRLLRPDAYPAITIRVPLGDNAYNRAVFQDGKTYERDARIDLLGYNYEAPILITLLSSSESLFFNFRMELDINTLGPVISGEVMDYITGRLIFVAKEGVWTDFFAGQSR